jgi:hypothetical protein
MLSAVYRKVEDLGNWIYVVIFDTIAMIIIFCTVVLLVIQGVALNTGVLPFSKGRALDFSYSFAMGRETHMFWLSFENHVLEN